MNYRAILKIYIAERGLTDDETAFLNILRRMSDNDRALFVEQLSDKPQKKPGKKSAGKGASKSARASSLQQQISGRAQSAIRPPTEATDDDDNSIPLCVGRTHSGECGRPEDSAIHKDSTYLSHHEFVAPAATIAASGGG